MCREGSGSSAELAQVFMGEDFISDSAQMESKNSKFFTESGWCGGLSVGARKHRLVTVVDCIFVNNFNELDSSAGSQMSSTDGFHRDCVGKVVDIFRCAGKMH